MDDWTKSQADAAPTSPHEAAVHDEAAAAKAHGEQTAWQAVDQGLDSMGNALESIGMHEAAVNTWHSAELATTKSNVAGAAAASYESASHHWRNAEHDLAEQSKLSGEALLAHTASVEAGSPTGVGGASPEAVAISAMDEIQSQAYALQAAAAGIDAAAQAKSATMDEQHAHWEEEIFPAE